MHLGHILELVADSLESNFLCNFFCDLADRLVQGSVLGEGFLELLGGQLRKTRVLDVQVLFELGAEFVVIGVKPVSQCSQGVGARLGGIVQFSLALDFLGTHDR